jgi:cytochrome b561
MTSLVSNQDKNYRISRALHWFCAISFLLLVISQPIMLELAGNKQERLEVQMIHQSLSTLFVFFLILRFCWMIKSGSRGTQVPYRNKWQSYLAKINHFTLYFLMIFMPVSGLVNRIAAGKSIMIFNWEMIPAMLEYKDKYLKADAADMHTWLLDLFYIVIALHVIGATVHVFEHFLEKRRQLQKA